MIIDVHYHLFPKLPDRIVRSLAEPVIRIAREMGKHMSSEEIIKKATDTWSDPEGENVIAIMEDAGIDLTLICMVDNASITHVKPENMQKGNRIIGNIARKYPRRIMALAGVDPRRPEAPDMLRQCFEEFGVIGLKYHPDDGYDPCGPESYKLLEVLAKYNGTLLTHRSIISALKKQVFRTYDAFGSGS